MRRAAGGPGEKGCFCSTSLAAYPTAQAIEKALLIRLSGKTRKGSPWLRTALVEATHAATHCKQSYLSAQYHRLVLRRGAKKATIAVGHTLLVIVYHVLADEKDYQELGGNYFDEHDQQAGLQAARSPFREAWL